MSTGRLFLLLHPVLEARTRLREALRAFEYDARIDIARTPAEGILRLKESEEFTTVFLSYDGSPEPLEEVLEAGTALGAKRPHFIVVLPNPQVDATHVAELFARGVDGFISEPYSSCELADLFASINSTASLGEAATLTRDNRMLGFLTSRIVCKLDEVADIQATRENVIDKLPRAFAPLKETLNKLYERDPQKFEQVLLGRYKDLPPPKASRRKIKRKGAEQVVHPGVKIKKLLEVRKMDSQRILAILDISEEELASLLSGQCEVDESLANGLARALGETPRYWLEMQQLFNSTQGQRVNK